MGWAGLVQGGGQRAKARGKGKHDSIQSNSSKFPADILFFDFIITAIAPTPPEHILQTLTCTIAATGSTPASPQQYLLFPKESAIDPLPVASRCPELVCKSLPIEPDLA